MKKLTSRQKLTAAVLGVSAIFAWLWIRDVHPGSQDIKTMEQFTAQMKTMCVGRFLIDVPASVKDASGSYGMRIASVKVRNQSPKSAQELSRLVDAELQQRTAEIKAEPPTPKGKQRFLGQWDAGQLGRVMRYLTPGDEPDWKADGYVPRDGGIFFFSTSAIGDERAKELVNFLAEVEPHLTIRSNDDIPKTAGFCIDNGLVGINPKRGENVNGWGWNLPGHPDVRFGMTTQTNGDKVDEGILDREDEILREMGSLMKGVKTLRKRRFDLDRMKAQEWSVETTGEKARYTFTIEIPGKPNDNAAPTITLRMRVGGDSRDGYQKPSLSTGEALALWDAVIHSLRLRPAAF